MDYFIEIESFRIFIRFWIRNVISSEVLKFSTSFSTKIYGVWVRFGDLVQWWVALPICDVGNALMNTRSRENDVIELNRPVSHRFSNLENRSLLNKIVTGVLLDSSKSHRRIFVSSYMLFTCILKRPSPMMTSWTLKVQSYSYHVRHIFQWTRVNQWNVRIYKRVW